MRILVRHFFDAQQSKILEIDVDERVSLNHITQLVSDFIRNDILLLPVKTKNIKNMRTLKEYCQGIQNDSRDFYFTAVNCDFLSQEEQEILANLSLNESLSPKINKKYHDKYAQKFIYFLQRFLPEDVQQALVVRLADQINMFGETYKDSLTEEAMKGESRYSVQIHPYPWLAAGASNVIIYRNIFNEISVALVYNQRRDRRLQTDRLRQAGVPDFWKLPEGYMHPRPCKGGENGITLVSSNDMDEAEELMLKSMPMQKAYKTIKEKRMGTDPIHQEPSSYDNSTQECAKRESYEEVGLKFSIDQIQLISQREENRLIPTIVNVYLMKSKHKDITPPTLEVDGIEIKKAIWGKLRAFHLEKDNTKPENFRFTLDYNEEGDRHPIEIPIKYALMIGQAIRKLRDDEIQDNSKLEGCSLFHSRENVEARVKQILNTKSLNLNQRTLLEILGSSPESDLNDLIVSYLPGNSLREKDENLKALANLGINADNYHKRIISLVVALKKAPLDKPLNADHLIAIAKEGPEIESRLLASRIGLFPLARLYPYAQNEKKQDTVSIPRFIFK